MTNKDWPRWIFASLAAYFEQVAESQHLPVFVETRDICSKDFINAGDRVEVRITGPFVRELSKGFYQVFVDINVLLISRLDPRKNSYDLMKYAGVFQEAMGFPVRVFNYGREPGDYVEGDPSTLFSIGCLEPRNGKMAGISHYGRLNEVDHIRQTECECKYEMEIVE
jgi:hypothetical protein